MSDESADGDPHAARFATIRRLTNKRQAVKICDVSNSAALELSWPSGRRAYVTGTDQGLWAVGYGSGGGIYMSRTLDPPQLLAYANTAEVDVVHDRDELPVHVRDSGHA